MKRHIITSLFIATALFGATSLHAQLVLENFSSFSSPNTLFFGDWSGTGDPFVGSTVATPTFLQGSGFYNFASATNADSAYVERSFTSLANLSAYNSISLTMKLLGDNTADSLTVFLLDSNARTAFATFQTGNFSTSSFTQSTIAFTSDVGFSAADVSAFRISGNDPFGNNVLSVALDALGVSPSNHPTAVPEPSTYGLLGASSLLGLLILRRCRRFQPVTDLITN